MKCVHHLIVEVLYPEALRLAVRRADSCGIQRLGCVAERKWVLCAEFDEIIMLMRLTSGKNTAF